MKQDLRFNSTLIVLCIAIYHFTITYCLLTNENCPNFTSNTACCCDRNFLPTASNTKSPSAKRQNIKRVLQFFIENDDQSKNNCLTIK